MRWRCLKQGELATEGTELTGSPRSNEANEDARRDWVIQPAARDTGRVDRHRRAGSRIESARSRPMATVLLERSTPSCVSVRPFV